MELQLRKIKVDKTNFHSKKEMTLSISKRGEFVFSASVSNNLKVFNGDKIEFYCDAKNAQKIYFNISSDGDFTLKKTKDRGTRFTNKNLRTKLLSFLAVDSSLQYKFKILEGIKLHQQTYYQLELIKQQNDKTK